MSLPQSGADSIAAEISSAHLFTLSHFRYATAVTISQHASGSEEIREALRHLELLPDLRDIVAVVLGEWRLHDAVGLLSAHRSARSHSGSPSQHVV
jgi:hypothetical protein